MLAHVIANIAFAYPTKSTFQKFLSVRTTRNIRTPFLNIGVLAIAEFLFCPSYEWTRIDGVEQLLIVERNTGDIYGLEPLFYLAFCPFALVNEQFRFQNLGF